MFKDIYNNSRSYTNIFKLRKLLNTVLLGTDENIYSYNLTLHDDHLHYGMNKGVNFEYKT